MQADLPGNPTKTRPVQWWIPAAYLLTLLAIRGFTFVAPLPRDVRTVLGYVLFWLALLGTCGWIALQKRMARPVRWGAAFVAIGAMAVFSQIDIINDGDARMKGWRWTWQAKPDESLATNVDADNTIDWQPGEFDYPGFLGLNYWAEVPSIGIATDWQSNPPELLWKKPIGAGWSAFAIFGPYAVTQEQRGTTELVSCYEAMTGKLVWTHGDEVRFDPGDLQGGLGGVGPRATPTIVGDRIYTQGATGVIDCLDARDGGVVWSHNPQAGEEIPNLLWAKSNSPLVLADKNLVVVPVGPAAIGKSSPLAGSLVALNAATGAVVWAVGDRLPSYATPVRATIAGVDQIIAVEENFVTAYAVDDGKELWQADWLGSSGADASCSQPIPLDGDRVLLSKGYGVGARLLAIAREGDEWTIDEVWSKPVLKTKFSNVLVRDGYAYAIDDISAQCVELETGKSMWKKRRQPAIGHGQNLLVGDLIFVLSEEGEGILIGANPKKYEEFASMPLLTPEGITWNNPALAGDLLLVRNNLEAAAYRLPLSAATGERATGESDNADNAEAR